jgi:hypothetical protein
MNTLKLLITLFIISNINTAHAVMDHSTHGGSGNRGNSVGTCEKPQLSKFSPANLTEVTPNSEFSFRAINIENPQQLTVTVKNIPVEIKAVFKTPFYDVTGKLPDSLHNTVARINIKASGKVAHCEVEDGWLVKITE